MKHFEYTQLDFQAFDIGLKAYQVTSHGKKTQQQTNLNHSLMANKVNL